MATRTRNAQLMATLLVKCEGNNSPKYDGKIWEEELKFVVNINGQEIDPNSQGNVKINPGDIVTIRRPGKRGKRGRNWHGTVESQSDPLEAYHMEEASPVN